jgi:pimeloyl-ACP methyl ester carboxylesterase
VRQPARLRAWRLPVAAVAAASLLITACSASSGHGPGPARASRPSGATAADPNGPVPDTLAGYYAQKLRWRPCDRGFQCARLLVPFDYQRPAWRRFSLPVIRLPATDPRARIGSLVVNPGGPGGSGVQYALGARTQISAAVRARFDVVGFDPRGVAGSIPAIHCLSGPQLDHYFETSDTPVTSAQLATVVAQGKLFARGCEQQSGALLPYVGTANAARDMDVLRAALGDAKLTYLGKSYGTYLGTWYAQLFPSHVRALVLDGAVDPSEPALNMNIVQAQGFQVALASFENNCLHMSGCPLGHGGPVTAATVTAATARIQALLNGAAHKPLISQITGQPGAAPLLLNGIAAALYSKSYWPYLREGLKAALAGNGTILIELGDLLLERNQSGQYANLTEAETAVDCVDRPWPRSLATWRSAAATAAKDAPMFGAPVMWGSLPCAYWPVRAPAPVRLRGAGAPPILVVGTTRDPATPFRWAQALTHALASGVLLGWNGDGHTAYMVSSSCVDSIVDRYLISLAVPRSGTICP